MAQAQVPTHPHVRFELHSERLGPLPLVNHFIERLGLADLLERQVPTTDRRCAVTHAQALGVLLRSIIVEREPIYRQQETVHALPRRCSGSPRRKWSAWATIASDAPWISCSPPTERRCLPRW